MDFIQIYRIKDLIRWQMVKTDTVIKEHQTSIFLSDKSKNQGYHIEDVQFVAHFFSGLIDLSHIYYWCFGFLPPSGVCESVVDFGYPV
jgi:hypothetical protein